MNRKLVITTSIILLASLVFFALMIVSENLGKLNTIAGTKTDVVQMREPDFRSDGALYFISNTNDTISKIEIEIAADNESRQQGLMYRKTMNENQGMLFIFEQSAEQNFWMKNTILPLDILYVDSLMQIVTMHQNTKPYSEDLIPSYKPVPYTVEVIGGYCNKYGIKDGMRIAFSRNNEAASVQ